MKELEQRTATGVKVVKQRQKKKKKLHEEYNVNTVQRKKEL